MLPLEQRSEFIAISYDDICHRIVVSQKNEEVIVVEKGLLVRWRTSSGSLNVVRSLEEFSTRIRLFPSQGNSKQFQSISPVNSSYLQQYRGLD